MNTVEVGLEGHAPIVVQSNIRPSEREIYRSLWGRDDDAYRKVAPGESAAQLFITVAKPRKGATVLDLGCGTGRGSLALAMFGDMNVTMLDFCDNCLDDDIVPMLESQKHVMRFVEADLTGDRLEQSATYGFCTDVMEHIPPADVNKVLNNCLLACQHVFFQIATEDDVCGKLVGQPLHLSVHPYEWWLERFTERDCVVHYSEKFDGCCVFYVSAWISGKTVVENGACNTEDLKIIENVKINIDSLSDWQQVTPHPTNDVEVMILGGGPSLTAHLDEIRQMREDGVKLICLNGSYNWALDHGLTPSALIVVDAREINAQFTRCIIDGCKYFIASQCDPKVLEGLPKERTFLWHTGADLIRDLLLERYKTAWPIPGGCTVLISGMLLLRQLGFKSYHLFGCDSCLGEDEIHHAYSQPWNDSPFVINVVTQPDGRLFKCHPWMSAQAQCFIDLIRVLGDEMEIQVHGDGLLAHIIESGAKLSEQAPSSLI